MKFKIIAVVLICLLFAACGGNQKPADLTKSINKENLKSQIVTVGESQLASMVKLPGKLLPFDEVNIFPKVNGFVKQLFVDRGSIVKKGQLLLILEAPEMESAYQSAYSKYLQIEENAESSREKFMRLKEAAKEPGSVSQLDLDLSKSKMKADLSMVKAELSNVKAASTMLEYLKIYAPFDGIIINRNVSSGALVAPGKITDQPMLVLQDIHKMRLTVEIPEDYVDKVDLTQRVKFLFNALPGQTYAAKISRSANSLGGMQQEAIEIDVKNSDGKFKPGMYAEVDIPLLSNAKSLLVPNSSIVRSTEREYVVRAIRGRADLVDIKEGLTNNYSTEVFGKLNIGDSIVLKPNDEIKENMILK